MACFRRRTAAGLIFHSDRATQYCSQDFQDTLLAWGIRSSMSREGNCWDNALTESLWGRLKTACDHGPRYATREQAKQAVMDWIAFYNHSRLHSALGYLSPMQFEQRWTDVQTLVKAIKVLRRIVSQSPLADMVMDEVEPGPHATTDAALVEYVKARAELGYHASGTCRMGLDEKAVVTPDLRVRGLENLYIADASVMPELISGNINAACMMIGEKLGRQLRG